MPEKADTTELRAARDSQLFSFSDRPVLQALGPRREQCL